MTKLMATFLLAISLIITSKLECLTGAQILNLSNPSPHPTHMRMFIHAHTCTNTHTHTHMQGETNQLNSRTNATISIRYYTCAHTRIYPETCASNMPNGVQMPFTKTT